MQQLKKQLNLSAEDLREVRVSNFCETAQSNALSQILSLQNEIRNLISRRESLLDLNDDSTTTIANKLRGVDSEELMQSVFDLGFSIREKERRLSAMKEDYEILFGIEEQIMIDAK